MAEVRSLVSVVDSYFVYVKSPNLAIRFTDLDTGKNQQVYLIIFERCITCNDNKTVKGFSFGVVKLQYDSRFPSQFVLSNLLCRVCAKELDATYTNFYSRDWNVPQQFNKLLHEKLLSVAENYK